MMEISGEGASCPSSLCSHPSRAPAGPLNMTVPNDTMSPREGLNMSIPRWHVLSMVFPKAHLASVTLSPFVFGLAHL